MKTESEIAEQTFKRSLKTETKYMTPQPNTNTGDSAPTYVPRAIYNLYQSIKPEILKSWDREDCDSNSSIMWRDGIFNALLHTDSGFSDYFELQIREHCKEENGKESFDEEGFFYALIAWWDSAQPFPETEMWAVRIPDGKYITFFSKEGADLCSKDLGHVVKVTISEVGGGA